MKNIGLIIIVNALIWGGVILACANALKDSGTYPEIQNILGAGAAISLIVVGGGLAAIRKQMAAGGD
ncbi:MAG: hypothetical protein PVF49_07600 [Anaerolineales bacterium]|jgi:hypothetical protein